MTITAALVVYAVIWFITLYVALPIGEKSQSESGDVVPGTPASAPSEPMLKRKVIWVTVITTVLWAIVVGIIISGVIPVSSLDIFGISGADR